jgi:hypothetical protein
MVHQHGSGIGTNAKEDYISKCRVSRIPTNDIQALRDRYPHEHTSDNPDPVSAEHEWAHRHEGDQRNYRCNGAAGILCPILP